MILTTGQLPELKKGFTLLEIMLLMVTVATILAMVTPSLRTFLITRQVKHTAAQLVALTEYSRTRAMAEGRTYRLNISARKRQFWLTAQEEGSFVNLPEEPGRIFTFPEGTEIEWLSFPEPAVSGEVPGLWLPGYTRAQPETEENEDVVFISFFPDGRTEPASLRLTDRLGQRLIISCQSPLEHFCVLKEKDEKKPS
ncbi:MAG TPA: hypothetical protein PKW42_00585 [bacterium]|nr:hypothetical protein [bacterium]HPP11207.1 hypothetical protein [bacterium]